MKRLLIISMLAFISFISCEKDPENLFCYECQTRFEGLGCIYCESEKTTVCKMTEKMIRNYEIESQNRATLITGEICETKCYKLDN